MSKIQKMPISGTFPPEIAKINTAHFLALNDTLLTPLRKCKNSNHRRSYDFLKNQKNFRILVENLKFSTSVRFYDVIMTSYRKTKTTS